jgi:hypothetical protein
MPPPTIAGSPAAFCGWSRPVPLSWDSLSFLPSNRPLQHPRAARHLLPESASSTLSPPPASLPSSRLQRRRWPPPPPSLSPRWHTSKACRPSTPRDHIEDGVDARASSLPPLSLDPAAAGLPEISADRGRRNPSPPHPRSRPAMVASEIEARHDPDADPVARAGRSRGAVGKSSTARSPSRAQRSSDCGPLPPRAPTAMTPGSGGGSPQRRRQCLQAATAAPDSSGGSPQRRAVSSSASLIHLWPTSFPGLLHRPLDPNTRGSQLPGSLRDGLHTTAGDP